MSSSNISDYESGLNWQKFCKAYAEYHGVKYSMAIIEAGEAWKAYKEAHGIESAKKTRVAKQPESVSIKRKDVPFGASGERKKNKVGIKPPPKGYKAVITYVRDEEEDEAEKIIKKVAKKVAPASKPIMTKSGGKMAVKKAPVKKAGLVKKKKEEVVEEVEESEEEEISEEVEESEEESGEEEE